MMYEEVDDSRYQDLGVDMSDAQEWGSGERVVLPTGDYHMYIKNGGIKYAKTTGNKYVNLQYTVASGEYQGRGIVFDSFYLWGEKSGIAKGKFASLRKAVGLDGTICGCIDDLIGHEFVARVLLKDSTRPNAEPGEKENKVSTYKPLKNGVPGATMKPAPKPEPVAQPSQNVQPSEQRAQKVQPWG